MYRTNRIARLIAAILAAAALAYPAAVLAQPYSVDRSAPPLPRTHFGLSLQVMQAVGEFSDSVDAGIGGGFNVRYNLDRRGIFALRGDLGFQIYGHESERIAFPGAPRVTLEQNTNNTIVQYNIGPQLMWPTGAVRPYAHGFIGGAYFATSTSLEGSSNDGSPFASSENYRDNNLSYGAGGGLYIPLRTRRTPVSIDLGARYVHNGIARYLTPGSISDDGENVFISPITSNANFVVYTIGVSIGAQPSRDRDRD